ncbi:SH3 domain-containing protein [Streptomyces sp. RB6PN25]|uniref:SH3 domain-containing protein n=1 Tax=Streptomyces humicola TaxID=2953240 RepID=A0ABT1PX37_9ACTN|nr:SH3 domain-containing protein [Streptomyces humicola]MCQ4082232.1 SH3 domain-containing protein [Streptomyces humicola]
MNTPPVVQVDGLRVRAAPGLDGTITGQLYAGDPVEITAVAKAGSYQQWDQVTLLRDSAGGLPAGYTGWVSQAYLSAPVCGYAKDVQCAYYGEGQYWGPSS